ncbi:MAG: CerR family C-terminal domain-containing protein [Desulfobacteraceae bacterium]
MMADNLNAKERLIEAAIDVFGKQGFSAATTRMIAQTANVNISAIPYYFNGKEGLYNAVVEYISEKVHTLLQDNLKEINAQTGAKSLNPRQAMALLENLLAQVIDFVLGSTEAFRFMRIILREQLDPSASYSAIYGRFMAPVLTTIAHLIEAITGITDSRENHLKALAVIGQVMAFRIGKETMVRLLDLKGYSPKETAEIRQLIIEQTRAALNGLSQANTT